MANIYRVGSLTMYDGDAANSLLPDCISNRLISPKPSTMNPKFSPACQRKLLKLFFFLGLESQETQASTDRHVMTKLFPDIEFKKKKKTLWEKEKMLVIESTQYFLPFQRQKQKLQKDLICRLQIPSIWSGPI